MGEAVKPDINGLMDIIASTSTKIFYVPVGGNQHNIILEQAMRKTNGKIIQDNEIGRLTVMSQVMLLAISIASEIRYSNNKSREVIKTKMMERSDYDDMHDDCLDMVHDFINPLRFENMRGNYVELRCNALQLGDRVRRGPDWTYDDQDLGLPGTVIGQDFNDWIWVEWDHGNRLTYRYDEQKDRYQVRKVDEARILVDEMIAVGCRVVRGQDWKYEDYDGGKGSFGTVLQVRIEGKVVVYNRFSKNDSRKPPKEDGNASQKKSEAWSLQVAAASNKIQKIEQHVQKIETQFLDDASTSEELTKDVSTLMNDTRGLNLVVDNVRNYVPCEEAIGEKHKVRSRSPTSQNCTLNTLGNDQECLKKGTTNNVLILDLQTEESLSHNIKQEETSMISQESSTGRLRRRSQDEFEGSIST
ncbi:E3 ubiquitin-protein ligase Ufd4-like [Mytilus trossulus]|uniref:E3 ubiquitin-protein ligase Ufd4-like n=1 Tax=Mytilus trossulus TaxID=6551 RepID=UPI0030057EEE